MPKQNHNRGKFCNNTSGVVGVMWHKHNQKWLAQLRNNGKPVLVRYFTCKLEAARCYNDKVVRFKLDEIGKPLNDLEAVKCDCVKCQEYA